MAVYEYKCPQGHITEEQHMISSNIVDIICPNCGERANRMISLSTFQFKCGGFYHTDYAQKNTSAGKED
jgi:putative FmdB family regulatory protein